MLSMACSQRIEFLQERLYSVVADFWPQQLAIDSDVTESLKTIETLVAVVR